MHPPLCVSTLVLVCMRAAVRAGQWRHGANAHHHIHGRDQLRQRRDDGSRLHLRLRHLQGALLPWVECVQHFILLSSSYRPCKHSDEEQQSDTLLHALDAASFHVQAYIRPKASGAEVLLVTRVVIFVFGMFTGVICVILNEVGHCPHALCAASSVCKGVSPPLLHLHTTSADACVLPVQTGVSVNFIFLIIGLLVSSAFPPLTFMLTWPKVREFSAPWSHYPMLLHASTVNQGTRALSGLLAAA